MSFAKANAQEMGSQNFKIQGGNFNMTSGTKSSSNFSLADTVGETAAGVFASKGFLIQSGFHNVSAGETFTFTVSPRVLDFGQLIANNPLERELHIGLSTGNVAGYKIQVAQNLQRLERKSSLQNLRVGQTLYKSSL